MIVGHGQPHQPQRRELGMHLAREMIVAVPFPHEVERHLLLDETQQRLSKHLDMLGLVEVGHVDPVRKGIGRGSFPAAAPEVRRRSTGRCVHL
jgi:hypothetical protein